MGLGLFLRKAGVMAVRHIARTAATYAAKEVAKKGLAIGVGIALDRYLRKRGFPATAPGSDDCQPREPDSPNEPMPPQG